MAQSLRFGAAVLVVVSLAAGARAEKDDDEEKGGTAAHSSEAKKKFAEGNERYARGDYQGAIDAFKAAIAIDSRLPGPYRNLGLAYRAVDRCADALPMYEKYLELRPESRFSDRVRREIDLCRAKLGQAPLPPRPAPSSTRGGVGTAHPAQAQSYLHVAANLIGGEATDEASVRIDGLMRGSTPLTIPITPGQHRVHLERPGFESADAVVEVPPGQRAEVELTMNKLPEEPQQPEHVERPEDTAPKRSYRKAAWALLGVAGGLALMGAGFGIAESQLHRDAAVADRRTTERSRVDQLAAEGSNYAVGAYVGLAAGGVALATSVLLFILDPKRGASAEPQRFAVTPSLGPKGGSVAAQVRW